MLKVGKRYEYSEESGDHHYVGHQVRVTVNPNRALLAHSSLAIGRHALQNLSGPKTDPRTVARSDSTTQTWLRWLDVPSADIACTHHVSLP